MEIISAYTVQINMYTSKLVIFIYIRFLIRKEKKCQ